MKCSLNLFFKVVCNTGKPLPPPMRGTHIEQKNRWMVKNGKHSGEHSGKNGGV